MTLFLLNSNLLSKDARFQWDKIVTSQVDTAPWTSVQGRDQPKACTKLYMSFMDCVMLHLQMAFTDDAAENETLPY